MAQVNFEDELGDVLQDYRALQEVCGDAPVESVLGEALDAGAGVLAINMASITDRMGLTVELQPEFFDHQQQRYGRQARGSKAIAPVIALIERHAEPSQIAKALIDQNFAGPEEPLAPPQGLADAERELGTLIAAIGTGGVWGDLLFAARSQAQFYIDTLRSGQAGEMYELMREKFG